MKTRHLFLCLGGALFLGAPAARALTPAELQALLERGVGVTLVDVRPATLFQKGHLPGAINVPAALAPQKQLPPLGRVVVYDDGRGLATATAAAALNQKAGIQAEVLVGGFAAWETTRGASTLAPGVKPEEIPMITYQDLKKATLADTVLVDLRQPPATPVTGARTATLVMPPPVAPPTALTDLQVEFPTARITRSPFTDPTLQAAGGVPPLFILIDTGDGSAQAMARALKANGVTRFAVLVGGEEIIQRKGQPGLQRLSVPLVTLPASALNGLTNQP
jgi:rhodanese-related sulfurtransferase